MAPGLKALLDNPQHLQLLPKQRQILYFGMELGLSIGFIRKELRERVAEVLSDCAIPDGIWKGELEEVTGRACSGFLNVP